MSQLVRAPAFPACVPRLGAGLASLNIRTFSCLGPRQNESSGTLSNLTIGKHTRVIFQGFTGRQATANARESLAWGTNIVGGVKPGGGGEHLGLPVLPSVKKAVETLKPDATGIYVAAHQAAAAIEEAIDAEVPLIVAVAEHIPLHDILRIHSILKTQTASRLVGANSPGIISSVGKCRIGFQPLSCFSPGRVGIVARSGTLSYETAASTLRSGLGQSMCIGVGGDILPGTTIVDGLKVLADDPDTEAIALVGEIGGHAELEAADWIRLYRERTDNPKPIVAIIGGLTAPPDRIMGHAGAFLLPGEPSALDKVKALENAGVAIVNHPSRFGPVISNLLAGRLVSSVHGVDNKTGPHGGGAANQQQTRGLHTLGRSCPSSRTADCRTKLFSPPVHPIRQQQRSIILAPQTALNLLKGRNVATNFSSANADAPRTLAITINRSTSSPSVFVIADHKQPTEAAKFDFDYRQGTSSISMDDVARELGFSKDSVASLRRTVDELVSLFTEKEAYLVETRVVENRDGSGDSRVEIVSAKLGFDDAAFRSCKRQGDIQSLRNTDSADPVELEAERDGIVYIKLEDGTIGTLVNGAGLAMNTVDALADAGGKAANFLDTGGKATSETVKRSFEMILQDQRVKSIFVNIFGGLTRGDMIAEGVVLAFKDLQMSVPVVVRIRGTNEKEGQKIIKESGLPLFAFDDFDEAAAKVIELAAQK
ncbi:succinyl-CoA synthetase-like protein [Microdochium trichocladiopsis]|uniref:Succinyl-CoA synthetase-like protein n=1 Tax=Microdochium trichocladiopsis TaxID=1682393 RepID=A0A9P9BMJ7_9PEZI|nr:succinyl-CoA synthetase-like protein [Microdochium trichocladiopsis]KAH7026350.1 succinyl-CoA synthetase-like protein [Microdochium trichocladiopsis]